ncbi:phospholipase/Carboxylesterase [Dactylonectria estremocensis]|uniref:Phospholipase/Carboxylesterase n=1 Tax=Dactylonectria estremocensis TaxID=1079267 RepID=A0A9P9FME6_9HYPO|nr:phospholipase/Carboxylesterase [Dactylonectria estremocensis]
MDHHNDTSASGSSIAGYGKPGFGPAHVLDPRPDYEHTHTAVMLHGRGSGAEEFAEELMASLQSDGRSLREALPGWRWVFPSSPEVWSVMFQEHMPAWFEAFSLADPAARQDLQIPGIEESVGYLRRVLDEERLMVGGRAERLVLGGISQGGAVGIWTLLCEVDLGSGPGGFVGSSTWVPFGDNLERILGSSPGDPGAGTDTHPFSRVDTANAYDPFVHKMVAPDDRKLKPSSSGISVLLGHGLDDAYVDIELGRQAARILSQAGHFVDWREYTGAEQEGHWFQTPDQMDHVYEFLLEFESR